MSSTTVTHHCESVRASLHAYRAGDVSPLLRERVRAHLAGCPACGAELLLQGQLEDAAKRGPEPLSDARKHAILARVHEQLDAGAGHGARRFRLSFALGGLGALSLAGAAALLVLFVSTPAQELVPLAQAVPGVSAVTIASSRVQVENSPTASVIELEAGAVFAEYQRPRGAEPLRIETPEGTVIVRGTVFFVRTESGATTVGVKRGKVEVVDRRGAHLMVMAGEQVVIGRDSPERGALAVPEGEVLARYAEAHEESPVVAEPAAPVVAEAPAAPTPQPARVTRPAVEPSPVTLPAATPSPEARLEEARAAWRGRELERALSLADALYRDLEAPALVREEALYLAATVQRGRGAHEEAARLLATLSQVSRSSNARLAQLERGRLLLRELSRPALAREAFRAVLQEGESDALAAQAWRELCASWLEEGELTEARGCLEAALGKLPDSPIRQELLALEQKLQALQRR